MPEASAKKTLGIIELLQRVGEDNIKLQNVAHSLSNINLNKSGDVTVSFYTGSQFITPNAVALGKFRNVGLPLWLPSELVEKAQQDWKAEQ